MRNSAESAVLRGKPWLKIYHLKTKRERKRNCNTYLSSYPDRRGFLEIFLGERESDPWSGDNELRRGEEGEKKPLVFALASNLTFMQMTAVKCIKLLITKVTKYSNLANMWAGVDPGKLILYEQSISTRVVKSDKMSLDLVDSVNRGQAGNLPGNLQQLCFLARVPE